MLFNKNEVAKLVEYLLSLFEYRLEMIEFFEFFFEGIAVIYSTKQK
jgi:hypothetical protein